MRIISGKDFQLNNSVVTIGKFDGLHMGHQELLKRLEYYRDNEGLVPIVFTFDRVSGELMTMEERRRLLSMRGPEVLIEYPFDRATIETEAEVFIRDILVGQCGAKVIVAGDNFQFGRNRAGNGDMLKAMGEKYGYRAEIVDRISLDGEIISSTLARKYLSEGHPEYTEKLLNKEFFLEGKKMLDSESI